jgi:hypothetical protein
LERDRPDELAAGLQRLGDDLRAGRAPRGRTGTASVIVWGKQSA